jgi:hypothetical protein
MKKLSEIIATMGEIEFLNYASLMASWLARQRQS